MKILLNKTALIIILFLVIIPVYSKTKDDGTYVTPHMDVDLQSGVNTVYCVTFQLAWNELENSVAGETLKINRKCPMADFLSLQRSDRKAVNEGNYVAMAGFFRDGIVENINNKLRKIFGVSAPIYNPEVIDKEKGIVSYAYLKVNAAFKFPFDGSLSMPFNSGNANNPVECFGFKNSDERKRKFSDEMFGQVYILYEDKKTKEKIIGLITDSGDDIIFLADIAPQKTMRATIEDAVSKIYKDEGAHWEVFSRMDGLYVPKVSFSITREYTELIGRKVKNLNNLTIIKASQSIVLELNEAGVSIESDAQIELVRGFPSDYRFDRPFLLMVHNQKTDYPYLAVWIENDEILVPAR